LYSVPQHLQGHYLDARADSELVKLFSSGQLVKTHPRQPPAGAAPTGRICRWSGPATRCAM
jgi:hypothetical protein